MDIQALLPKQFVAGLKSCDKIDSRNSVYSLSYQNDTKLYAKFISDNEYNALNTLQKFSFTPKLVSFVGEHNLALLSEQNGVSLNADVFEIAIGSLVTQLSLIHQEPLVEYEQFELLTNRLLSSAQIDALPKLLKKQYLDSFVVIGSTENNCLLHGDFVPQNILVEHGNCSFIDWEYTCVGNPIWDLAALSVELNLSLERAYALVKDYVEISEIQLCNSREYIKHWLTIYAIVCFNWSQKQPEVKGFSSEKYLNYLKVLS